MLSGYSVLWFFWWLLSFVVLNGICVGVNMGVFMLMMILLLFCSVSVIRFFMICMCMLCLLVRLWLLMNFMK